MNQEMEPVMLMALLYTEDNFIAAAAPACDVTPIGNSFWATVHSGDVPETGFFETAFVEIADSELRDQLLMLGIDQSVNGFELARRVDALMTAPFGLSDAA